MSRRGCTSCSPGLPEQNCLGHLSKLSEGPSLSGRRDVNMEATGKFAADFEARGEYRPKLVNYLNPPGIGDDDRRNNLDGVEPIDGMLLGKRSIQYRIPPRSIRSPSIVRIVDIARKTGCRENVGNCSTEGEVIVTLLTSAGIEIGKY